MTNKNDNCNVARLSWIDDIRAIAISMVIFGHALGYNLFSKDIPFLESVNSWIVSFNMPLFVIMSGYTNCRSFKKICSFDDVINYIDKSVNRLLVPSVMLTAIVVFILGYYKNSIDWLSGVFCILVYHFFYYCLSKYSNILLRFLFLLSIIIIGSKYNYFWFLPMLVILQTIMVLIAWIVNKSVCKKALFLAFLPFIVFSSLLPEWYSEFGLYYCFGLFLYETGVIGKWKNKSITLQTFIICMFFVLGLLLMPISTQHDFYKYPLKFMLQNALTGELIIRQIVGVSISLSFILLIAKISKRQTWFTKLGIKSLYLYIYHVAIICLLPIFARTFHFKLFVDNDSWYMWGGILLYMVLITLLSLISVNLLSKLKVTRIYLLGKI